jgi:hypothetical protein
MRKTIIGTVIALFMWSGIAIAQEPKDSLSGSPSRTTFHFDKVEKRQVVIPPDARCGQWWQMLLDAGWKEADLPMADRIMFRESRCNPAAHNRNDPTTINQIKGSLGLFQINLFWLSKTTSYPNGYLQTFGVANRPIDLFVPVINARAALALFDYSESRNGCGWAPWATDCN